MRYWLIALMLVATWSMRNDLWGTAYYEYWDILPFEQSSLPNMIRPGGNWNNDLWEAA